MDVLLGLTTALSALIVAGSTTRLIILGIQTMMDTEDKSAYRNEIKHVFTVLVIALVVASGCLPLLIGRYFN